MGWRSRPSGSACSEGGEGLGVFNGIGDEPSKVERKRTHDTDGSVGFCLSLMGSP